MSTSKKSNPSKTDTNSTPDKLERLKQRRRNRGTTTVVTDYESFNSDLLKRLIAVVAKHGTITFGYTRDGGAYYINYWVDGESFKEYLRPTEDADAFLQAEIDAWTL
ncbi:MAG: hypothetical protein KJO69_06745 [Gammaproteobacteria bacterium]|nr:hypothetical protein [Gammaproteobacteria bacterium]